MKIIIPTVMVIIAIIINNKISKKINPRKYEYFKNMPIREQIKHVGIILLIYYIIPFVIFLLIVKDLIM